MFCPLLVSQGEADGVSTSEVLGSLYLIYIYSVSVSQRSVSNQVWLVSFVLIDDAKLRRFSAHSNKFHVFASSCDDTCAICMTPAWTLVIRVMSRRKKCEKHAEQRLNDGAFHFASFIPLPRLLSLSAYKITTFLQLTSSQFILTHPNSSILILINLSSPPPATLLRKPCLFTPLPMPPNLIKDRTLSI